MKGGESNALKRLSTSSLHFTDQNPSRSLLDTMKRTLQKSKWPKTSKCRPQRPDRQDGNPPVLFTFLNSVLSRSLISLFKQTSSIRFFSPSVNSVMFASSSWMKTVHIISNPLVCLSLKSGWALWVKSGPFFGGEENKMRNSFLHDRIPLPARSLSVCRRDEEKCQSEIRPQERTHETSVD